jgi:predicted ABC-type ATPase
LFPFWKQLPPMARPVPPVSTLNTCNCLIAGGLSPFAPDVAAVKAARIMLESITELERRGESFAFEMTLSGLVYAKRIRRWREAGYHVTLFFLSLPNPQMAIDRVAERVRQGGHNVPSEVIRRRFDAGLLNFEGYIVMRWILGRCMTMRAMSQYRSIGEKSHEPEKNRTRKRP